LSGTTASGPEEAQQEELTLEQIWSKYPRRWVAIVVTRRDANDQPTAGNVVQHDVDRYRLRMSTSKYKDICILYAGEPQFPLFL
jgi:hypothetical protein